MHPVVGEVSAMRSPRNWLERPHQTNRDALIVSVVGGLAVILLAAAAGVLLASADVIVLEGSIPTWLAFILLGLAIAVGMLVGAALRPKQSELQERIDEIEARKAEVQAYESYAEHIGEVLADVRKVLDGVVSSIPPRDFVEKGIFEPAHVWLTKGRDRGEVRFSILHPEGDEFVMADDTGMYPAHGHSLEGRSNFRLPIDQSFAGLAYRRCQPMGSGDVDTDERFTPHPKATRPYKSIYSVPLHAGGDVTGVFNVIAEKANAFDAIDRTYIRLLAAVTEIVRAEFDALNRASKAAKKA